MEVWQTSNLRRLRLGEEKERRKKKKNKRQDKNIMVCPIPYGDHNKMLKVMQNNVATHLRCCRFYNDESITNLPLISR